MGENEKVTLKLEDEPRPSKPPPSAIDDVTANWLLTAVQRMVEPLASALKNLTDKVNDHDTALRAIAESQVKTAQAASEAAVLASRAMTLASTSLDDTQKMVTSAMTIQKSAIAAAVTEAVKPIGDKVSKLEENDVQRAKTLQMQDDQLLVVVSMLSQIATWHRHWAFRAALFVGGIIGGAIASYLATRGH